MIRAISRLRRTAKLRRRLHGAVSVMTATFIATVGLAVLVSIDIGNLFYTQRALQRSADLAAMAAVQRLDLPTAAQQSVVQNGLTVDGTNITLAVVPGVWDASAGTAPTYFTAQAAVDGNTNAAQVTITRNVPYFFMVGQRRLQATAIAKNTPIVSFSLASGLASVNSGLLNQVLGMLLGNSNPLSLDLVSYQGLANTNVRVADLMVALGVSTVQQLLATQVSLNQFVTAVVSAGAQNGLAGVSVSNALAPNALVVGPLLHDTPINVGNSSGTPGVLQFLSTVGNDQSALNAQLNVLDLLSTAAQIANAKNGVALSTGLNLPGLLGATLNLKIIQPPVLAFGPPGKDASGNWRTKASTSQVQLGLNLSASVLGLATISVPIGVTVAGANAHVVDANCPVPRTNLSADISGAISPVAACIAAGADSVSNTLNCSTGPAALIGLLTLPLATIYDNPPSTTGVPFGSDTPYSGLQIAAGQTQRVTATSGVFSALLSNAANLQVNVLGIIPVNTTAIKTELAAIGSILDTLLTPVLELLGIQLGYADIKVNSVSCDAVELVF